jgi:hypothetical protein
MTGYVRRVALAVVWLAVATVVALGAAGLVGAMAHQPGTPARAELTWAGDRAIEPRLRAVEDELVLLAADLDRLGELGRGALAALVATETETLDQTVTEGQALAASIDRRVALLREDLATMPGTGPLEEMAISPAVLVRRDRVAVALGTTVGLSEAWSRLALGAVTSTRVTVLLVDHDTVAGEAAAIGRAGNYADALVRLDEADAMIVEARRLRDGLRNTVDVSTLTQWLDRNAEYDAALRRLYQALVDSGGRVNQEVRDAFAAERSARELLPPDTRGLVIILAEIARGGLNQAVIGIEQARGELEGIVGEMIAEREAAAAGAPQDGATP